MLDLGIIDSLREFVNSIMNNLFMTIFPQPLCLSLNKPLSEEPEAHASGACLLPINFPNNFCNSRPRAEEEHFVVFVSQRGNFQMVRVVCVILRAVRLICSMPEWFGLSVVSCGLSSVLPALGFLRSASRIAQMC